MSSHKRSIVGARPSVLAVATVLLALGQAAAQPASERLEEIQASDGQQNAGRLPAEFHDTLQATDELAASLSTANEKLAALVGRTRTAATDLYWQLEATRRERDELSGRVVALGEEVRQSEAEIAGLSLALEASEQQRRQVEQVGEEVAEMKDELLGLRHLLQTANAALVRVQAERDAAYAETEALRAEVTTLLNTALASLQQKPAPAGPAPGGSPVEAPAASTPEAQDRREAGL